ncbi:MAG: hypothetical protein ABL984_08845 [Pyrinomonadaceae bacterium]
MKGLDTNNLCSHGGDMLAYLYDEMAVADRGSFELHLADCGTCIDNFAELSQSRYPVYEWKRAEFDRLPTPRVVIPVEAASVSWFEKLRATFAFRPAFAFGTFAAIAVVASLAALVMIGGSYGTNEVAGGVPPVVTPVLPTPEVDLRLPEQGTSQVAIADEPKATARREETPKAIVKASSAAPKQAARSARPKATQQAKRNERIPALNTADEEDDSLRLADIFEEIGISES